MIRKKYRKAKDFLREVCVLLKARCQPFFGNAPYELAAGNGRTALPRYRLKVFMNLIEYNVGVEPRYYF